MKYSLKKDRVDEIRSYICPGTNIWINLFVDVVSKRYMIEHGIFMEKTNGFPLDVTYSIITGERDGFVEGLQTPGQVGQFILDELDRLNEMRTNCVISPDYSDDGVTMETIENMVIAWTYFQQKFVKAKENDQIIPIEHVVTAYRGMQN
ncbi:MAG: hypothetical protein LCH54_15655 [Bacteroidetes bacterium]|nr:hypothetical protein [Bacteroidota bacterium]